MFSLYSIPEEELAEHYYNIGLDAYQNKHFSEAAKFFLKSFNLPDHPAYALESGKNLAFMVRRGEIFPYNGPSVKTLLEQSIKEHDPEALINLALFYVQRPNPRIDLAKEAIERVYPKHPLFQGTYDWWKSLAENNDPEGFIVMGWLAEFEVGFEELDHAEDFFKIALELGWHWDVTSIKPRSGE